MTTIEGAMPVPRARSTAGTLVLLLVGLVAANALMLIGNSVEELGEIGAWKKTHYFFDYQDEFVKRGLVGECFRRVGVTPDRRSILGFSLTIANALCVLLFFYFRDTLARLPARERWIFVLLFLVSPATLMQIGFELGRFDPLNYLLVVVGLLLVLHTEGVLPYLTLPCIVSGMLIHEAFLFIHFPLLLAVTLCEARRRGETSWLPMAQLVAAGSSLGVVVVFGKLRSVPMQEFVGRVLPFVPDEGAVTSAARVLYRSFGENLAYTVDRYSEPIYTVYLLISLPVFLLYVVGYWWFKPRVTDQAQWLVLLCPLAMLPLFVIGVDTQRWLALMIFNMFLGLGYLVYTTGASELLRQRRFVVTVVVVSGLAVVALAGPFGVNASFPALLRWVNVLT